MKKIKLTPVKIKLMDIGSIVDAENEFCDKVWYNRCHLRTKQGLKNGDIKEVKKNLNISSKEASDEKKSSLKDLLSRVSNNNIITKEENKIELPNTVLEKNSEEKSDEIRILWR